MTPESVLLARQPIFDERLRIIGYELLFRPEDKLDTMAPDHDGDRATSQVMLNAFTEIGMRNLIGDKMAFINYTRSHILSPPPFQDCDLVVEVLEDVAAAADVVESLLTLKDQGYTIALDDFVYHESLKPLIELADIVKVDVLDLGREGVTRHVEILSQYPVKLLAEKIEDQEMYDFCKELGFHYFQGYFLSKPKIIKGRKIPANKMIVMQLIMKLQSPNLSPKDIHDTITKDPALSYKVLRMINSAAWRRPDKIESLMRAIILVGINQIRRWASFLALSSFEDKPSALHEQTMIRSKMCEFLGMRINNKRGDEFFTLGMLSLLDAFFDLPLEELLNSISLSEEMNNALLQHSGQLGFVLKTCIAYEKGDWSSIDWAGLTQHGISINDVKQSYLEALRWDSETGSGLINSMYEPT